MNENFALPNAVHGHAGARFKAAVDLFSRALSRGPGGGALAIYLHGEPVVDIWTGYADKAGQTPWSRNTASVGFSTTKGITATVIHRLADRGLIDYDAPIAEYRPEFGAQGKQRITVRQGLIHAAGLSRTRGIARDVTEFSDHELLQDRIAGAAPDRFLGRPAYHALTFGWLFGGLAQAVTGKSMAELFRTEIAEPLDLEGIYLGAPPKGSPTTVAEFSGSLNWLDGQNPGTVNRFLRRIPGPIESLHRTISLPGLGTLFSGSDPTVLHCQQAGLNGVMTARALGAVYTAIAGNGRAGSGRRFLTAERVHLMSRIQSKSIDRTLCIPPLWRLGYMSMDLRGTSAFGHQGMGGTGGWADPASGLAVGFIHNRLAEPRTALSAHALPFRLSVAAQRALRDARPPSQSTQKRSA